MPAPAKREDELARPRARKGGDVRPVSQGLMHPVTIPPPDPAWHPIATGWYLSLQESGMADYYQTPDWWFAYALADDLSIQKRSYKVSAVMMQTIYSAMARLGVSEGDRRQMRIELSKPVPVQDPIGLQSVREARARLQKPATKG